MSLELMNKVFLVLQAIYIYNTCSNATITPLNDPKKHGYSKLIQDIKAHAIAKEKIPPRVTSSETEIHNKNNSIEIMLNLMPVDVLSLDPAEQVLELSGYISLVWYDTDLTWNASDYGGVEIIEMPSSDLWIPTLSVLNGVENNDLITDGRLPLSVHNDGIIIFTFSVNLKTSCSLDLMFFPFDEQSCKILIYSLSQYRVSVTPGYQNDSKLLESFSAGGEWLLTEVHAEMIPHLEYQSDRKMTQATMKLRRKTTFYLVSVVGPMALFTVMNCLVFLVPPESGEKVSFLISIFISNAVFSSFINGVMPRGLDTQVPLLMVYLTFMWVWSIVIFFGTVIVLKKFYAEQARYLGNQFQAITASLDQSQQRSKPWPSVPCDRTLSNFMAQVGCNVMQMRKVNQVKSKTHPVIRDHLINASENPSKEADDNLNSLTTNPIEDAPTCSSSPTINLPTSNPWTHESKAKTLDRVFLFLSLFTLVAINLAFILMISNFQLK